MKKKIFKYLKIFSVIFILLLLVIISAVLWPLPKLDPPKKFDTVLIQSVNIIDVKSGGILENRDILIKNNIISAIDTTGIIKVNSTALIIYGSDKYIVPGLWDMHTHSNQHSEWLHHPLYIANGVTGIRDLSGQLNERDSYWVGSKERLRWNTELLNNERITPRY
jgi:predicted amidohydrolase YtcJ